MTELTTQRGIRYNNPLRIRKGSDWQGACTDQADDDLEKFESITYGLRAGFKILKNYMSGYGGRIKPLQNVYDIVSRWNSDRECDKEFYIIRVCSFTGLHPYERIAFSDRNKMIAIIDAMCRIESGAPVSIDLITSAYDLLAFKG